MKNRKKPFWTISPYSECCQHLNVAHTHMVCLHVCAPTHTHTLSHITYFTKTYYDRKLHYFCLSPGCSPSVRALETHMFVGSWRYSYVVCLKPKIRLSWRFYRERFFPQCFHSQTLLPSTFCRDWSHCRYYSKVITPERLSLQNQHAKGSWPQKPRTLGYSTRMLKPHNSKRNLGFLYFKLSIVSCLALVKSREMK